MLMTIMRFAVSRISKYFKQTGQTNPVYNIEDENKDKYLNFLDIKIKSNNRRCEFDVYCKPSLTNVQITPYSCISLSTITSIFKGFLARATKDLFSKILESGNRISD